MEPRDTLQSVQPIPPHEYLALLVSRRHLEWVRPHRLEELALRGALRDLDTGTLYVSRVPPRSLYAESGARDERR
jgi:hypothetical protein